jgi:hypothetical protein
LDADRLAAKANGERRRVAAVMMLLSLLILSACAGGPVSAPPVAETGPFELTVAHSNDTWGYLDPCG